MTLEDIKRLIDKSNYPVAYRFFKTKQEPPYLCYYCSDFKNVNADDKNYKIIKNIVIELYTSKKDVKVEQIIEDLLDANDICFDKSETYLNEEKIYIIYYEMEII